jgi:hypothetical protein
MQTPRTDPHEDIVRLAIAAAVIAFLLPLLPVYGLGSGVEFIFSMGLPLRGQISFFLGGWANAAVVAVGILFLRQGRLGSAGGVFTAVALILAIFIARQVLETAPHFGQWQTDLVLTLEILQSVLLALAAVRAIGARSA